jgi:predicted DNA-binding transcriptional regulator AlpA
VSAATLTTKELADLLGVSDWALYESVRRGNPPIEPIRVGQRLVWSRVKVDELLSRAPRIDGDAL